METPSDDDQDDEDQDLKRYARQFVMRLRHQPVRLTILVQVFFVLCLENSAKCQSDNNRMIFNVVDSILLSPDCVNKMGLDFCVLGYWGSAALLLSL